MHSVFGIHLKQSYIFKNRPFYISFVLLHFQAGLNIPKKIEIKIVSYLSTHPIFFQGVT